jgi:ectoine hydroxylase-related dioxygenase (phytanoyl-CoA dioxygenase family)
MLDIDPRAYQSNHKYMDLDLDSAKYEVNTRGYTILRAALPASRIRDLRIAFDGLLAKDERQWGKERLVAMRQYGAIRNLANEDDAFVDLLQESPVYELLDKLLAQNYILHSFDGLVLFPGDGRFPWDFHTDVTPLTGVAFPACHIPAINCLYYLDDVSMENGATWMVPSSHKSVLMKPPLEILAENAHQAVGRSGDVLMFDGRIWHCAGENKTQAPRRVLKTLFCEPWFRPQMDYWRAIAPEIRRRFSQRTLRLIGSDSTPPSNVEDLRLRLLN